MKEGKRKEKERGNIQVRKDVRKEGVKKGTKEGRKERRKEGNV